METTTEYKCPNCGAPMHFLPESQRLTCDYCASSFSIEEASAATEAQNAQEEQNFDWGNYKKNLSDEKLDGTKTFSCPSCGASVVTLATTMSLVCPYCKNNMVLNEAASGGLKPNKIIPFKLTEDKLQEILRSFYKEKKLIPSAFVDAYKKAKPVGVYVPFWLFDSDLCGDAKFSAKKSHSRTSGNYRITTTEHYVIKKSGNHFGYPIFDLWCRIFENDDLRQQRPKISFPNNRHHYFRKYPNILLIRFHEVYFCVLSNH